MLFSGIIKDGKEIRLNTDVILPFILNYINSNPKIKEEYELFLKEQIAMSDTEAFNYVVKVLGWVIIQDSTVYYCNNSRDFDKVAYIKEGFDLKKMNRLVLKGKRFVEYISPKERDVKRIGFVSSFNPENELSYWYPKTANIGFRTPETFITEFTDKEFKIIKKEEFNKFDYEALLTRIKDDALKQNFDLNRELFLRFGCSSNKFNFGYCHLGDISLLPDRLLNYFDNFYDRLVWQESAELVLREFINTNYYRRQIYNGMPLNTEFRVFFDFDTNEVLGIYNYWDKDATIDNLYSIDDRRAFADTTSLIEKDFNKLAPYLEDEAQKKLPNADLNGKWLIDFMYDGFDFVLIDMVHSEGSYYEKILEKQLIIRNNNI